ncbi:isochorismatase family protein [Lyngbya confervoides]|uniref:nicotinamidase n=1 Tax=Lyngbya confervoides BDU141951 TaxID=1574623 RepID=A0ABD4T7F8_9CYAN|nr:isochorismatase family protein [Lyngbya confervoides]MCM1984487.1 isochorismatase family protein [Lyngbya confervoides BDU141951]
MADLLLSRGDALVIVDVQRDFLPGGALAVPGGNEIIPILNLYIQAFAQRSLPVWISQDCHPPHHCSFIPEGGSWPPHCIAGTPGSQSPSDLKLPPEALLILKGQQKNQDAYSAFQGTALAQQLQARQVETLFVGGLATDYCVLNTVQDAIKLGFRVLLLTDAIRAVNRTPEDGDRAEAAMIEQGAIPITYLDIDP